MLRALFILTIDSEGDFFHYPYRVEKLIQAVVRK